MTMFRPGDTHCICCGEIKPVERETAAGPLCFECAQESDLPEVIEYVPTESGEF